MEPQTFYSILDGFEQVTPQDLVSLKKGGMLRYAIDTVEVRGNTTVVTNTRYLRGGLLSRLSPDLSYLVLFNPYTERQSYKKGPCGKGITWAVRLGNNRDPNERVRLWYKRRPESEEIQVFRKLLQKLESGELKLNRQ